MSDPATVIARQAARAVADQAAEIGDINERLLVALDVIAGSIDRLGVAILALANAPTAALDVELPSVNIESGVKR